MHDASSISSPLINIKLRTSRAIGCRAGWRQRGSGRFLEVVPEASSPGGASPLILGVRRSRKLLRNVRRRGMGLPGRGWFQRLPRRGWFQRLPARGWFQRLPASPRSGVVPEASSERGWFQRGGGSRGFQRAGGSRGFQERGGTVSMIGTVSTIERNRAGSGHR